MQALSSLYTRRSPNTSRPLIFLILILLLFVPAQLSAAPPTTFSNSTLITINAQPTGQNPPQTDGIGAPYPSNIVVSGLTGVITNVEVIFNSVSHTRPDDIDALLVGPNSSGGLSSVLLMSDSGDTFPISGVTLTFSDSAASSLPDSTAPSSGTYHPTDWDQPPGMASDGANESFDTGSIPLPVSAPYGTALSAFTLANPNTTWSLYVYDDRPNGSRGSVAGGWRITITTNDSPVAGNDGPFTTPANTPLNIPAGTVLANDSDPENNPLTPILVGGAANGNVVQNPDQSFTYTPNADYNGPDNFTYKVNDGFSDSNVATVSLIVGGTNNVPIVDAGADQAGSAGTPVNVAATYTDADPADTHTATIDWNDGSPLEAVAASAGIVNGTHMYSVGGTYNVTVTVTDSQGGSGSDNLLIFVDGATPEVTPTFTPTPEAPQPTPTVAPATPLPLLTDYNGINIDDVLRSDVPLEVRYGIFARLLMRNGHLIRHVNVGMIGNQALLDMGVVHAVDIFTVDGVSMAAGVRVCFDGNGTLYFLDAAEAPRVPHQLDTGMVDGRTCAWIFGPGTVVMVDVVPVSTPEPGTLTSCEITTLYRMHLREEPSLDSDVLTTLPSNLTVNALDKTDGWFRVVYGDYDGWLAALYVSAGRNC